MSVPNLVWFIRDSLLVLAGQERKRVEISPFLLVTCPLLIASIRGHVQTIVGH